MTLFELQEWLGHRTPAATQHYAKITSTKLAKSYAEAGYFKRNLRAIEELKCSLTRKSLESELCGPIDRCHRALARAGKRQSCQPSSCWFPW